MSQLQARQPHDIAFQVLIAQLQGCKPTRYGRSACNMALLRSRGYSAMTKGTPHAPGVIKGKTAVDSELCGACIYLTLTARNL